MKFSNLYIGTLSGTSADSIDAALFDIGKKIKVVGSISKKIPQNLKSEIIKLSNSNKNLYKHPTKKLKCCNPMMCKVCKARAGQSP